MKPDSVRTSIDLPCELHRRIHEAAARKGCSARKLILEALRYCLNNPKWRLSLQTTSSWEFDRDRTEGDFQMIQPAG
jgi:metal-responsive CopG/Arc/MetJ family transcriptional regulator